VGLGYSISQKEELELIIKVAQHTGVVVDPTYTGTDGRVRALRQCLTCLIDDR
jgi:1-aminocyclopropane-1-carboxylate deaminase/D-cysteine desulfhydrase-like pyridoxal-dependent ACC family enzyme